MDIQDLTRVATAAVAFISFFAGHYAGDQWIQSSKQAAGKSLDAAASAASAHWHCAKHVFTYILTGVVVFALLAFWFHLPVRPGWLVLGVSVNAATHYLVDLRTPLRWLAGKFGKTGYINHCRVSRPTGIEATGPGTGLFHLDQAWHFFWIVISSAIIAGS